MKQIVLVVLAALLLLGTVNLLAEEAAKNFQIGGQLRYRFEADGRDFTPDTDVHSYSLLRTRLNLEFTPAEGVLVFLQPQDSRLLGGAASGNLENDDNLGVHQAYARITDQKPAGLFLQVGRFEYAKGNQRLLGSVGWHNVGRSWDGLIAGYAREATSIEFFRLKLEEGAQLANDDKDLLGAYLSDQGGGFDLFFLWEVDNFRNTRTNRSDRFTAGGYFSRKFEQVDLTANLAYQFGSMEFDAVDISAYLLTLELGYTGSGNLPYRLAAGVDIASGDSNLNDDEIKSFDNLYYTGHKFRGHMDYFVSSGTAGLNDYLLRGSLTPAKGWQFKGDLHIFRSNVDYASAKDGSDTKSLGTEIDLSVTHQLQAVQFLYGFSIMLPSEDWQGQDADPGLWGYFQLTVTY